MESTDVINEIRGILPRNSIGKYDLLTIFTHKTVFDKIVKVLSLDFQNKVDYVAAPEAIGWILGTAIAKELGVGFIGVRKGDKLPYAKEEIISTHFTDLPPIYGPGAMLVNSDSRQRSEPRFEGRAAARRGSNAA